MLTATGLNSESQTRQDLVTALIEALLTGPTTTESLDGIAGWFPTASLDDVVLRGTEVEIRLTVPATFLSTLNDTLSDAIHHAFSVTLDQVPDVLDLRLLARSESETEYHPLDSFTPVLPPVGPKPYEAPPDRSAGQPGAPGQGQYAGSLSGKSVFLSQSHGWYYHSTYGWITQRPNTNDIVEDFINAEAIDQYLIHYLWNAGAGAYTCRERDMNTAERIIDNGGTGYTDSGSWNTSTSVAGYYGSNYRTMPVAVGGGATATWTPSFSTAGTYAVYVWYTAASDRSTAARYTVSHAAGDTLVVQNQQRDGFTWTCLGFFYFDPAAPVERRRVTLSNQGSDTSKFVIADAARFGGGMGSIPDGGSTSGRPRFEESGRYHAEFMGCSSCGTGTVTAMPRYAAWESESWEDSVYISWHTNAPDPGRGTSSYIYTGGGVQNSAELQDYIHAEIINDIRAGYQSDWTDRGQHTASFGEVNPANNGEMPGLLLELAFHDTPADALCLKDPKFRMLSARAIYQGIVKFYAWKDGNQVRLLPEPPINARVFNKTGGGIRVEWNAPPYNTGDGLLGDAATGYRVYLSTSNYGFQNAVTTTNTYYETSAFSAGTTVFVRVAATNAGGESFPTPVLAVRVAALGLSAPLLIVDGFDRLDRLALIPQYESSALGTDLRMYLNRMNTYSYVVSHAVAVPAWCTFDSCVNEAVAGGIVSLSAYQAVDWISGEESTVDETFSSTEQARIASFVDAGGNLFVSGPEIGWDLDAQGATSDRTFYNQKLKADYVLDDAGTYTVAAVSGSIFAGIANFTFDNGSAIYDSEYPDVISALGGSQNALTYSGTSYTAGITYAGTYKLVNFGFPFEGITSAAVRTSVMTRIIDFIVSPPVATATPTTVPTVTRTPTLTQTRTLSPTLTSTPTPTRTPTRSSTLSPTRTASPTLTSTLSPTRTASPTLTSTLSPTRTLSPTVTATVSPTRTLSPTQTPSSTATRTPTPSTQPSATSTRTPTAQPPTATSTRTATLTPTQPHPTSTPVATATRTSMPTNPPSATPSSTLTPTEPPSPTASPTNGTDTPTVEPTFYPDFIVLDLLLTQDECYRPGDWFKLSAHFENYQPSRAVDFYCALDVYGAYFFYPDWSQELCYQSLTLATGVTDLNLLEFTWPYGAGNATGLYFAAVTCHPASLNLASNVDMIEFCYESF